MESTQRLGIKQWAEEDRPREKLLLKGVTALSSAELIAILIGSGNKRETAVELAQRILNGAGNSLNQLSRCTIGEMIQQYDGIGEAKAISIVAALELGRRRRAEESTERRRITSSRDAYLLLYPLVVDLPYEECWAILLNANNRVLERVKLGQGGTSRVQIDIKLLLKAALTAQASGVILCHNHPSGVHQPSGDDNQLTLKVKEAAALLDMVLLDHIIVCEKSYYSYADQHRL